jgi:hypothetical protein
MARHPAHILELAKHGAEVQLRDLLQEIKYLIELFPHLRDSLDEDELPLRFIMARDAGRASTAGGERSRSRRPRVPGATRKPAERMKHWSATRKTQKG